MSRLVVAVMAAALLLSGCSGSSGSNASISPTVGDISLITVGASDTFAPKVTWPEGLPFLEAQSTIVWQGKGAALMPGQPVLLDIYVQSLSSGAVLENTFDSLPESTILAPEMLGDDIYTILTTARVGTRVLSVAPATGGDDGDPAIVIVIDVLSDRADGETMPVEPDRPRVDSDATGEPNIVLDVNDELPVTLETSVLIRGTGIQIEPGSFIVAQFKAIYATDGEKDGKSWKANDTRQSTWPPAQAPFEGQIGVGKSLKAWDEGLIDQTVGSRVMLIVPEEWGYPGEGTIIYVIDILAVWNRE